MAAQILQFISRDEHVRCRRPESVNVWMRIADIDWWRYRHSRDFEEGLLAWCRLIQRGELPLPGQAVSQDSEGGNGVSTKEDNR